MVVRMGIYVMRLYEEMLRDHPRLTEVLTATSIDDALAERRRTGPERKPAARAPARRR